MGISVVIPAYGMQGFGAEYLDRALQSIPGNYEIIVSDDNGIPELKEVCQNHGAKYIINDRSHGTSGNLNNAIDHASGDIIKVLFQDDELGPIEQFNYIEQWGFCTSKHNTDRGDFVPTHPESLKALALGCNTYGSPSAMAFRKVTEIRFNESLKWLLDVDFYVRMIERYGLPNIVDTFVKINQWEGQATHTIATGNVRLRESEYISEKYAYL